LACADNGATVRLWDLPFGPARRALTGHHGRIWCVAFAPDGRTIATTGRDETVKLWDTARQRDRTVLGGSLGGVSDLAIPADGTLVLLACGSGEVKSYDLRTGAFVASRPKNSAPTGDNNGSFLTRDGRILATRRNHT